MANVIELTEETFEQTIKEATTPIVVDFWAEWCGPCKTIAPILDEIASEHAEKITVAKLNIDEHGPLALKYQVQSIPTMLLFKDGEVADRIVGAKPKDKLVEELGLS